MIVQKRGEKWGRKEGKDRGREEGGGRGRVEEGRKGGREEGKERKGIGRRRKGWSYLAVEVVGQQE